MSFARALSLIALAALLTGCALPSTDYPKDSKTQDALDKCRTQAAQQPAATPNPFGVVADQNAYVVDCMKAAGYNIQ
jgi:hypothetical protein